MPQEPKAQHGQTQINETSVGFLREAQLPPRNHSKNCMVCDYCDPGVALAYLGAANNLHIFHYYYKTFCAIIVTCDTKLEPEVTGSDTVGWTAVSSNRKTPRGNSRLLREFGINCLNVLNQVFQLMLSNLSRNRLVQNFHLLLVIAAC